MSDDLVSVELKDDIYLFGSVSIGWADDDGFHNFEYIPSWTPDEWKVALEARKEEIPVFKLILADVGIDEDWTSSIFLAAIESAAAPAETKE